MLVLTVLGKSYKSPRRCVLASLARSRSRWKKNAILRRHQLQQQRKENDELRQRQAEATSVRPSAQPTLSAPETITATPPHWKPLPGHHYSAQMIALCCQLGSISGFRAVPKLLHCIAHAFGLDWKIPSHDAVRNWTCRSGVALLDHPAAQDWIWMIDHSVQLGRMNVLLVLGIHQSDLPTDRVLRRCDMSVLAVLPSTSRKKEQVAEQLKGVAEKFGQPIAVLSDGATELHWAIKDMEKPVSISDLKHRISNGLKKQLGSDEDFVDFSSRVAKSAASIRQTELDHLQPPRRKDKCRFMNIHREIDWARMVLKQLDLHASRCDVFAERLREKLGWIAQFRESIVRWQQCRQLIGVSLKMGNRCGLYRGATEELKIRLSQCQVDSPLAMNLRDYILSCYAENEAKLDDVGLWCDRLPCSTEVLESSFGSFKAMQRHHNRGTFTTLLAALPTIFSGFTAPGIRAQFQRISNQGLQQWYADHNLKESTHARRAAAYAAASA